MALMMKRPNPIPCNLVECRQMRVDNVLHVRPVGTGTRWPWRCRPRTAGASLTIVWLGKESRRPQDETGQPELLMEQLAQMLGGHLGDAVDVLRHRRHVLGDPCRWCARWRRQRTAECTRRTREDEGADRRGDGFLEQRQRAGDVRVDELLATVGGDVWLVQRRRVQHDVHALHAPLHERAINDGACRLRER